MFSYSRKSAQNYEIKSIFTILYVISSPSSDLLVIAGLSLENENNFKFLIKRFGSLVFCRTFAIPNSSGGGEMVDTLL